MFVYPSILPSNYQAFSCTSKYAFTPVCDIVLSIEYSISGNPLTEAGISFFIVNDSLISGGQAGADLCYSGLSGINDAVLGVGIDSTGTFGLSGGNRDGYAEQDIKPNSIAARGSTVTNFALSAFNFYETISNFNLISNNLHPKGLRFRLGNVARTLYLDYKDKLTDPYINIASINIGEYIDIDNKYKIGIGFTTPVSSSNPLATAKFYIRKIHYEGFAHTLTSAKPLIEYWENIIPYWTELTDFSWS